MALIDCPECKKPVSTAAHACPNCGYPVADNLAQQPATGTAGPSREGVEPLAEIRPSWWGYFWHLFFFWLIVPPIVAYFRRVATVLRIFPDPQAISSSDLRLLVQTFRYLTKLPAEMVPQVLNGAEPFIADKVLLNDFVEQFYNYWRSLHRFIICDSFGDRFDKRPYRTFNDIVESLMHLIRGVYRDIQENITGTHPSIYRQVSAGAEIAAIARPHSIHYPNALYRKLNSISVTSQVLIYPPMIFETPMNKRTGVFQKVDHNPLEDVEINPAEWLCYPAKVGALLIMVYFSVRYFELGYSLSNLFDLAESLQEDGAVGDDFFKVVRQFNLVLQIDVFRVEAILELFYLVEGRGKGVLGQDMLRHVLYEAAGILDTFEPDEILFDLYGKPLP